MVNLDEIKVGDLVEMTYTNFSARIGEKALGYVTSLADGVVHAYWSDEDGTTTNFIKSVTGHWKVIDFTKEKVNHEEENKMVNLKDIQVGDLVEMTYISGKKALGLVCELLGGTIYGYWSDTSECFEDPCRFEYITGHWKVINYEEENKMNENHNKVLTGKEAIEALLEGKTLRYNNANNLIKFHKGKFLTDRLGIGNWDNSMIEANTLFTIEFTEYVQKPQVGDWVRVTINDESVYIGEITKEIDNGYCAYWNNDCFEGFLNNTYKDRTWEILTPEQVSEYKREQVFVKAGRKLNEFKTNDLIEVLNHYDKKENFLVHSIDNHKVWLKYNLIDSDPVMWYHAKDITPVYFVESKVSM